MRVLIAMRSLDQSEGGPITAAFGLADALRRRGHDVTIAAHDDGHPDAALPSGTHNGVEVVIFPRTALAWEHSKEYASWLNAEVRNFDLVVINSLWISHVHYAAKACRRAG